MKLTPRHWAKFLASALALVVLTDGRLATDKAEAQTTGEIDRTVLPLAEPKYPPVTELDARKVKPPARFEVKAPKDAPNVLIVLIDDIGFGQSSAFGGLIHMPTLKRLAASGLRYNQFHTTALCSPTRSALLTERRSARFSLLFSLTA